MTETSSRMLLIVDPQIDFITGTLPVPGAEKAMDALASYVDSYAKDYALICVTCDRHPLRHSSFLEHGGQWPAHCVESSVGAAVWPPLMMALEKHSYRVRFVYKGENIEKDEYSIFQSTSGANYMERYIKESGTERIDICGLAGDVCVANTLQDALKLYPDISLHILTSYTSSLDGGTIIASLESRI